MHTTNKIRRFPIFVRQRKFTDGKKVVAQNKGKGHYKIENRTRKRTLETKEPNLKNFSNSSEIMTKAVKKIL